MVFAVSEIPLQAALEEAPLGDFAECFVEAVTGVRALEDATLGSHCGSRCPSSTRGAPNKEL